MGKTAVFAIGRVPVGKSVGFLGLILDVAVLGEEIGETLFRIKLNVVVRLMAQLVCAYSSVRVGIISVAINICLEIFENNHARYFTRPVREATAVTAIGTCSVGIQIYA